MIARCQTVRAGERPAAGKPNGHAIEKGDIEFATRPGELALVSAIRCTLFNDGKQEANNVVIDVPFTVDISRVNSEIVKNAGPATKSINIGTLRPGVRTTVDIWAKGFVSNGAGIDEYYSLSFAGGRGELQMPFLAYGWVGSVAAYLERGTKSLPGFIIVFLPIFLVLYFALVLTSNMGRSHNFRRSSLKNRTISNIYNVDVVDSPEPTPQIPHRRRY